MASDQPNYLKAAFLNVYNLSLFGGALAATALTGQRSGTEATRTLRRRP